MASEKVNVVVADDYLDRFSEVVKRAKEAGLQVEQPLETIGVVSGSIDPAKLAALKRVEGVTAVEPSRDFQLAPPESEIQSREL
jgi:hypothetical protein